MNEESPTPGGDDAVAVAEPWSADRWHAEWRKSEDARLEAWRELHALKQEIRAYLERPSTDGHPNRQEMRRLLLARCLA